jgi:hypothetical protein
MDDGGGPRRTQRSDLELWSALAREMNVSEAFVEMCRANAMSVDQAKAVIRWLVSQSRGDQLAAIKAAVRDEPPTSVRTRRLPR